MKPTPTHYCQIYRCKLRPEICQQRKAVKCRLKNQYMIEYGAYFKACRDCKGPLKIEEKAG
jgi:hypothetical protein